MQMIKQIPTEYQTFDYKPLNKKATPNYDNTRLVGQGFDNTMNAIKGVSRTVSGIVGMAGGKMGGMGGGLGKSGLMTQGNVDMTSKIMGGQAGGILPPKKLGKFGEVLEQTNFLKKGVKKLNYKFKSKKAIGVDSLVDGATTFIDSKKIKDEFGSEDEGLAAVSGALNYGKDGAAIGMTVGGPVGAAIGASVGAVAGGIGSAINAASKNKAILNAKTIAENQATAERVNAYYQNNGQMGESYKQKNAKTGLKNIKYKYQKGNVSLSLGRKEKDPEGGLTQKGINKYNSKTGSNLKMAVTTDPSKLKEGSKDANRRKSFCARMGGMKGAMNKPNGEPTRKKLALDKWNCKDGCNDMKTYKYKTGSKELLLRKNGKYSQRGLWDNIRANKGSGKEPSKEMVKQENKIKKYNNGTREILTEDREAHFVKKGKKYILLNDTTKPVTHANNKNEGRNAIVVAKNKYKLKDIINHNHSVSNNPEDSLILPEKSSIVTANNGMNKLALDAYKKGNYKMIDDIINKMPTDGKRKYYDGTEELEKDSFGYDNTGQAGGRTVEKDTYRENKKNEEYRKKIQSDKTFRMSELKKGNVKYTQDGKLNYKPKGGNSKNQWEFAGQVKRKEEPDMNQLEPKKAGLNIEPTIIDPNSIPKMPVKTDIQSTKNVENKSNTGFNIADNLSLRISDINNIVKGSSLARTNQIFNPDLKLQNYRDLSNPTRLKSEQAKNANVNNAKETSAGLSSNFRNNAQNAVNEDYNRQQEINNYEISRADAIQTNNVDSINKYSINEAEQKAAKQVADFQEIDSKESQFHKGLEGVDENNFRNRKLNQENNLAEQGYNIDKTREATNRLVIEDSIRNGRQTTPINTETLTKEQQDYRNNLSDKDKEKLGIKRKHGSKMLKLKSKYKMR